MHDGPNATLELKAADWTSRAIAAFQAGRMADAERFCREALARDPQSFDALHLSSAVAASAGDLPRAVALVGKALEIRPGSADAHCNLGEYHRRAGELDLAALSFQRAIALDGRLPAARNGLGLVRLSQGHCDEAITHFKDVNRLAPGFADSWHNLGVATMMSGKADDALAAYRQALQLAPRRLETLHDLGNVYIAMEEFEQAAVMFRAALAINGNFLQARLGLARAEAEQGLESAVNDFREAVQLMPGNVAAWRAFGGFLIDWGHFEEATEFFAQATAMPDAKPWAFISLASSRKFTAADDNQIAAMIAIAKERDFTDDDRATLDFAIAKALDDRGRFADAIGYFDEGNQLWRRKRPFDRERHALAVERTIRAWNGDALAALAEAGDQSEVPIFIIGMPRSGSTLVEQVLASHPDVAAGGEMSFWAPQCARWGVAEGKPIALDDGRRAGRAFLGKLAAIRSDASRVTSKQLYNFLHLGILHALLPNARIIHCQRHPVDSALSIYFTRFAHDNHYAFDRDDIVAYYRGYRRLMDHWRPLIATDRLMHVDYERMAVEPERVIPELIAFCGLDWNDACLKPEQARRPARTASAWQVRQPIYDSSVARWRNYEPWLGALRDLMP